MTHESCPCDLVTLEAFELLTDAERQAMEGYIAECPELEAELADFRSAVAAIPYSAPPAPLSDSLKGRLFDRINAEGFEENIEQRFEEQFERHAEPDLAEMPVIQDTSNSRVVNYPNTTPDTAVDSPLNQVKKAFQVANVLVRQATSGDRLTVRFQDLAWQPYRVPGVTVAILHLDLAKREAAALLRAEPGVQYPIHRHAVDEEIYMLEGDLIIDGQVYGAGDYIRSKPTSTHAPSTAGGCMFFVRTSLHDEYFADLALQD